jgi:hypothetical protein
MIVFIFADDDIAQIWGGMASVAIPKIWDKVLWNYRNKLIIVIFHKQIR